MLWPPRQQAAGLQFWLQCPPEQIRIRAPESGRLSKNPYSETGSLCNLEGESLNHSKSPHVRPFHKYSLNVIFGPRVVQGHSSARMRPEPVRPAHWWGLTVCGRDRRQSAPLPPRSTILQVLAVQLETGLWGQVHITNEGYAAQGSTTGGSGHAVFVTVISCHLSPACSAAHQTALFWGKGSSLELLSGLCGLDLQHSLSPEIRMRKTTWAPQITRICILREVQKPAD